MSQRSATLRGRRRVLCAFVVTTVASLPARAGDPVVPADPPWLARSRTGMVAADSPAASQIGADVLAAGGNAFDAAVATSLALAVSRPESTGLGGGGFLVAYLAAEKRFVALDFRETAPAAATAQRYAELVRGQGDGPPPTIYGGHAVGVPGQPAGLAEILRRFGTRPWKELVAPAIALAERGFELDEHYVDAAEHVLEQMEKWPVLRERHAVACRTLLGDGTPPRIGDRLTRPELAAGLRLLAEGGPETFYRGPLAEAVARAVQSAGGVLTLEDLAAYKVRARDPLRAAWHDYEIVTMPPPSSGGVCLIETLNILDALRARRGAAPGNAATAPSSRGSAVWPREYPVELVRAFQHAFADRSRWLGDPDFTSVPVALLIDKAYAERLAQRESAAPDDFGSVELPQTRFRAAPGEEYDAAGGTSHFCVADRHGNVVAMTETVNGFFGSLVITEPYGILLNNEMDDFAADPGRPNLYGLVQGERNAVVPGKRPLSSMTPTIVLKDGRPVLTLGASGGPKIITAVTQVLLNVLEFGMPLDEAVAARRLHHQWLPDEVVFDGEPAPGVAEALRAAGLKISAKRGWGVVEALGFLPDQTGATTGTLVGASDPRKGGRPAGVVERSGRPPGRP